MKMSRRAKRMQKHHKRHGGASLNMVSLMDIFTILVFFLLVNSANVQMDPSNKVKLPESKASQTPKETLIVTVTDTDILVQGRKVADISAVINTPDPVIKALQDELDFHSGGTASMSEEEKLAGRDITIMGDKEIPYRLLKKIMVTCTKASYTNISLAVLQKTASNG
ncbi:MAG: biopolymer transporter ExbD [Pseudomonadota bacterium]